MEAEYSSKSLTPSDFITQSHKPEDDNISIRLQNISFLAVRNGTKVRTKAVD